MKKDFWSKSTVVVVGGGSWGTVLASLVAKNVQIVHLWVRNEEHARAMNSNKLNPAYVKELKLPENIRVFSDLQRAFQNRVRVVIWAIPSKACRVRAKEVASLLRGDEVVLHATKGIEEGTMKRISEILSEELPCSRIGVISGPNLASEIAQGQPAATVVASRFDEVVDAGKSILTGDRFRVYTRKDVVGIEWAGALKNIYAIAAGALDELHFGWNTRSLLLTRGLAEMVRFGVAMGAEVETFLGLAGVGDLFATCSSSLSRNYRVGQMLAQGKGLDQILRELGAVAEGVRTTQTISAFSLERKIEMPITQGVAELIQGQRPAQEVLSHLMKRPMSPGGIE